MSRPSHRQSLGEATPAPFLFTPTHENHHKNQWRRHIHIMIPMFTRSHGKKAADHIMNQLRSRRFFRVEFLANWRFFIQIPQQWRFLFVVWCNDTKLTDDHTSHTKVKWWCEHTVHSPTVVLTTHNTLLILATTWGSTTLYLLMLCLWGYVCSSVTESWRRHRKLTLPRNVELSVLLFCTCAAKMWRCMARHADAGMFSD